MANTTNFGWETPDDTDLVKDGASAMRTLGNAIDSSLVDLKGGTTGQVLSKASNTDMDFTWVAQDDSNAIQNAIVDAKGDLISATAADSPARLAVGTDGQVLTADSTTATGLKWSASDPLTTKGDLFTYSTTKDRLPVGTNGQYLQADSTTATGLKWAGISGGGVTLLSTTSLGSTSTTVSGISQDYQHLLIIIQAATWNTGATDIKWSTNNFGNDAAIAGIASDSTTAVYNATAQTSLSLTNAKTAHQSNGYQSAIWIYNYTVQGHLSGSYSTWFYNSSYRNANGGFGFYSGVAISSFTLTNVNSYTFTGGSIKVYGVK